MPPRDIASLIVTAIKTLRETKVTRYGARNVGVFVPFFLTTLRRKDEKVGWKRGARRPSVA